MNLNDLKSNSAVLNNERSKKQTFIPFNKLKLSEKNSEIYSVDGDLADSIREHGLNESLTVARLDDGQFEILSGNRRYVSFKKLLEEDSDFRYVWVQGDDDYGVYSPVADGIPCKIIERKMSEDEKVETILSSNNNRDYKKEEIYNVVMEWKDYYTRNGYQGKLNEVIAKNAPVSSRTVADILSNKWMINDNNIDEVKKCGGWEEYCKAQAEMPFTEKGPAPKVKMDDFNKEYSYLDKVISHHEKMDFDKLDIKGSYYDDLRNFAIMTIKSIMDTYNIFEKDLRD